MCTCTGNSEGSLEATEGHCGYFEGEDLLKAIYTVLNVFEALLRGHGVGHRMMSD